MDAAPPPQTLDPSRPRSAPSFTRPAAVPARPYQPAPPAPTAPTPTAPTPAVVRTESVRTEAVRTGASVPPSTTPPTANVQPRWQAPATAATQPAAAKPQAAVLGTPVWPALARGIALLFGTLLAIDLFGPAGLPLDGPWWLDVRPLPHGLAKVLLSVAAAGLLLFASRADVPGPLRGVIQAAVLLLIALALKNATVYYGLMRRGDLHGGPAVAFSLHIAGCLGVVFLALRAAQGPTGLRGLLLTLTGFNAALLTLPLVMIATLGPIDHRCTATAAVLFLPPDATEATLTAGVSTAAGLYRAGLVRRVLLCEPAATQLQPLALAAGLPAEALAVLPAGPEHATFRRLRTQFPQDEEPLLAVGRFDTLPGLCIRAQRQNLPLLTVPIACERPTRMQMFRESLALVRCCFGR